MDYVKIPQNVRVEDKLIGPLSIRQIIMIAIGGGFSYTLYAMINKTYGTVPVTLHVFIWFPAIIAAAFAVVRINDISLFRYCLLIGEMLSKPRRRVWQPRQGLVINVQTRPPKRRRAGESEIGKPHSAQPSLRLQPTSGATGGKQESGAGETKKSDIRLDDLSLLLDRGERGQDEGHIALDPLERNVDSLKLSP